jgi:hypothetical protein
MALACSVDYHLTGSYDVYEDAVQLAAVYDKILIVHNKKEASTSIYNREGAGCVLLFEIEGQYKLASILDADGQHITCFSKVHPLIVSILEEEK